MFIKWLLWSVSEVIHNTEPESEADDTSAELIEPSDDSDISEYEFEPVSDHEQIVSDADFSEIEVSSTTFYVLILNNP